MGTNPVTTPTTDASLRNRALNLKNAYTTLGNDFSTPVTHTDSNGAVFTFTKDPVTGEVKCSYQYHNEQRRDILLFERATVATSRAGLTYLNEDQLAEYKRNHPNSYVTTEYAAANEAVAERERLEGLLNHYDDDTRKNAREAYEELVAGELYASGTVDMKTAKKMAKYARQDAQAGQRAAHTTVYFDKDEYNRAKRQLKAEQEAAEVQIEAAYERGFQPNAAALEKMEEQVLYIKDKDVREYIERNKDLFFVDGKFSSEKYQEWIRGHLQGDNTLTTGERAPAATTTRLSERDMKHAARDGGFDTQNDATLWINMAKTAAAIAAPIAFAYFTNKNIHDVSEMSSILETYASSPDPDQYYEFLDAVSKAESLSEVRANFRDVAVRNAFIAALIPAIAEYAINPEGYRDKVSDARTAATITTQNVFRGTEVTHIEGEVVVEEGTPCDEDDDCSANIKKATTDPTETPEDVIHRPSYFKETNERSYWYDFVQAYNYDHKKYSIKDIYRAIQRRNGYTAEKPNPPSNVMLPLELHDAQGNVIATRKDDPEIPRHPIPIERGNGKGNAPGGTPRMTSTPGTNKWTVYDCDGKPVGSYNTEAEAKTKYRELTGRDFVGTVQ